ncbi:low molecular weight protein arginine phosphatase [Bacillus piscicola]|uniref:low molecular weight protein arginine phosphatase n=1 Tax=Bacillus piscicola TaxID=1632684 RepID=UPI001F09B95C
MAHILFVCTGNTCRSPLAEALLLAKAKGKTDIKAKSAGLFTTDGMPASQGTIEVLRERELELNHTSSTLTKELVHWADVVLTMTKNHLEMTAQQFPEAADKMFTIKEFALDSPDGDVMDPFGGTVDTYRATAHELEQLIDAVLEKIHYL